ncbi:MAG: hypothetical protein SNJ57_00615 [Cyanobacteriota bacterium]
MPKPPVKSGRGSLQDARIWGEFNRVVEQIDWRSQVLSFSNGHSA